ncbi:DUF3953 domain-containing protein [Peribacillus frigoritolerans]|uniref:DUF3953 domain-containing protein n=1 Tax=Peribacillus frigoritolerans TaxID=450367 RepID=UPI0025A26FC1|nr:DUF3953 domain-containing protein [Peribacillus frigoritolerans]MDM5312293.1 DUF3953 domain-containing protein [Peribacillus frigoritolerans]
MTGLSELQKDRKGFWGYMNIVISLFIFFVSIQGFLTELSGQVGSLRNGTIKENNEVQ